MALYQLSWRRVGYHYIKIVFVLLWNLGSCPVELKVEWDATVSICKQRYGPLPKFPEPHLKGLNDIMHTYKMNTKVSTVLNISNLSSYVLCLIKHDLCPLPFLSCNINMNRKMWKATEWSEQNRLLVCLHSSEHVNSFFFLICLLVAFFKWLTTIARLQWGHQQ